MNESHAADSCAADASLPTTIQACHVMIRDLATRVAAQARLIERTHAMDPTDIHAMLAFQQSFNDRLSRIDPAVIEAELAAEDAMRQRRRRPRKKN